MSFINAFYRNPATAQYLDQLFGGSTLSTGRTTAGHSLQGQQPSGSLGNPAAERALARIVEMLSLGNEGGETPAVSETLGHITSVDGTEGDDTLTLTGRSVSGGNLGAGNDKVTAKSQSITDIAAGDGNDTLQLSAGLAADIDGGSGDDDIGVIAKLAMDIAGGDGNDVMKIAADTILGADGGDGNDTMTLEGNRIFASGGTGDDTVTIRQKGSDAYAEWSFAAGDGKDTITTDGPLSIRLTGIDAADVTVERSGNTLTASFAGSSDRITVTLDDGADTGYKLVADQGGYLLKIG